MSLLETTLVVEDDAVEPLLEPRLSFLLADLVADADGTTLDLALGDTSAGSSELNVEVHTVDTSAGVVLDTEINVLLDAKAKVAGVREVLTLKLVFLDLKTLLEDLLGLLAADGAVAGDLLIPTNVEASDGVSGLREDGLLVSQGLEDTSGLGKSVTTLSDTDVNNKLLNLDVSHGISAFVGSSSLLDHLFRLSDQDERKILSNDYKHHSC